MKVGIDFGTSTSEIAFVDGHGKVTVIPNHLGEIITPSVVYYGEDGVAVGREAREMALIEPENTVLEVKRLLGRGETVSVRGKRVEAVDVAAEIIGYLVRCAEEHLGEDVGSAVITVPAYFTDAQRRDVYNAGERAGLDVSRIINEPTAASLDYGINHMRDCKNILVYDLGGGTLDVTVLELFEGVVDVKASCGNNELGGKDFDSAIINYITGSIKRRDKVDVTRDSRAMTKIKFAAEACKIALSGSDEHLIELPFLYEDKKGNPADFTENIGRETFEGMIRDMIYATKTQIDTVLSDAELAPEDIDLTLLVGGSTRIPLVTDFLENEYGFISESAVNPDLAVVSGAAVQAGVLSGVLSENAVILTDICPHSLSTECLMDMGFFGKTEICDIIIKRNTTLPAQEQKIYATASDDQTAVHIKAYQGESPVPSENHLLGMFALDGIPKGKAHSQKINIRFEYDLNGLLTVSAQIVSTGKSATVTVNTVDIMKNLDVSKWTESPLSKTYRRQINKADRMTKIHGEGEISAAVFDLKKGLVLGWEKGVLDGLARDLDEAIEDFEE
jgi:molecular chaperone DnaK